MPATSTTAATPQSLPRPIGISQKQLQICVGLFPVWLFTVCGINLGGLFEKENTFVAWGVNLSSESVESLDLGELQMIVFKSSWKSDGVLVEPAGGTPEPAYAGTFHHVHASSKRLKTEPRYEVASVLKVFKYNVALIRVILMKIKL